MPITQFKTIGNVFGNWIFVSIAITHLCCLVMARLATNAWTSDGMELELWAQLAPRSFWARKAWRVRTRWRAASTTTARLPVAMATVARALWAVWWAVARGVCPPAIWASSIWARCCRRFCSSRRSCTLLAWAHTCSRIWRTSAECEWGVKEGFPFRNLDATTRERPACGVQNWTCWTCFFRFFSSFFTYSLFWHKIECSMTLRWHYMAWFFFY